MMRRTFEINSNTGWELSNAVKHLRMMPYSSELMRNNYVQSARLTSWNQVVINPLGWGPMAAFGGSQSFALPCQSIVGLHLGRGMRNAIGGFRPGSSVKKVPKRAGDYFISCLGSSCEFSQEEMLVG